MQTKKSRHLNVVDGENDENFSKYICNRYPPHIYKLSNNVLLRYEVLICIDYFYTPRYNAIYNTIF